jgi:hypothetical protein
VRPQLLGNKRRSAQLPRRCIVNQALAGSNPAIGAIFIATNTSNRVAVLRTLPEMVMSASETGDVVPPASQDGRSRRRVSELLVELQFQALRNRFPQSVKARHFRRTERQSAPGAVRRSDGPFNAVPK